MSHDKVVLGDKVMGDRISVGDVEGVGIAIGAGASVRIYGDVHYYPIKLRAPLREVFDPLIEDRVELFAGRDDVLTTIADFIQEPAGGYFVITAPAGFGKTALIANLLSGTPAAFAYHFFTATYVTDGLSESFFLRNVVEQMAEWHGHDELLPTTLHDLSALYHQFLDKPLDRTQILVIDGLDEVTWDLKRYLARRLPANLHVILTVRDVGQDWMTQYGLPTDQTHNLPLDGLTREEVAQVLHTASGRASTFADDPVLIDEIMCLSAYGADETLGADPFYVRLLAEDAAAERLTSENVASRPQGLDNYLDEWWQQIKDLAGEAPIRDLFGTLTVALGPISRQDLEAINPSLQDDWTRDYFDEVLYNVRRWVVGDDERGYALAHPRLRHYMRTRIKIDPYQEKLLDYCAERQEHHSPYALAHYAQHLAEANQKEALYALIDKPWMDVKFECTYSHHAFAEDVVLAIEVAGAEDPPNLVQVVRDCLIYATLGSLATNVPPWVMGVLSQVGQVAKARGYATLMQDAQKQSDAYRLIGEALLARKQLEEAKEVLGQAFAAAEAIGNKEYKKFTMIGMGAAEQAKADALIGVAQALAQAGEKERAAEAANRALAAAKAIDDRRSSWEFKAKTLIKVAQALDQMEEMDGLNQVLMAAETIEDEECKAYVLSELAQALAQADEFDRALAVAETIEDEEYT